MSGITSLIIGNIPAEKDFRVRGELWESLELESEELRDRQSKRKPESH